MVPYSTDFEKQSRVDPGTNAFAGMFTARQRFKPRLSTGAPRRPRSPGR